MKAVLIWMEDIGLQKQKIVLSKVLFIRQTGHFLLRVLFIFTAFCYIFPEKRNCSYGSTENLNVFERAPKGKGLYTGTVGRNIRCFNMRKRCQFKKQKYGEKMWKIKQFCLPILIKFIQQKWVLSELKRTQKQMLPGIWSSTVKIRSQIRNA